MAQGDDADGPKWKYAGYGEIVLDCTDCWLTTLPMEDGCMKCWLSFNEEAVSMSASDSIVDYFLAVMAWISDHPDRRSPTLEALSFDSGVYKDLQEPPVDDISITSPPSNFISQRTLSEDVMSRLQTFSKQALSSAQVASSSQNSEKLANIEEDGSFFGLGGDSVAAVQLAGFCANSGHRFGNARCL
ncbi:MAG: hypothetical protein Q9223_000220 [Gallowayella weberi]